MRKVIGIMALALLLAAPVFGQSGTAKIEYFLGLKLGNGDNTAQPYAGGSETGLVDVPKDSVISWSVRVVASGDYSADADPAVNIWGVANAVWDLQLLKAGETDPVGSGASTVTTVFGYSTDASTPGFFSSLDSTKAAAFAKTFKVVLGPVGPDYYTVKDNAFNGGPGLSRATYPTAKNDPSRVGNTALSGTLMGMGAGYTQYVSESWCTQDMIDIGACTGSGPERPGVGLTSGITCGSDSITYSNVIAEGQMNLKDLPAGNYVLKLVPGKGNNVLRGDTGYACENSITGNFATAPVLAGNVVGDDVPFNIYEQPPLDGTLTVTINPNNIGGQFMVNGGPAQGDADGVTTIILAPGSYNITFTTVTAYDTPPAQNGVVITAGVDTPITANYILTPVCDPATVVSAFCRRTYTGVGDIDMPLNYGLPASGIAASISPHTGGNPIIVVNFSKNLGAALPTIGVATTGGTFTAGSPSWASPSQLLIPLTAIPDLQTVTVSISGLQCENNVAMAGSFDVKMAVCVGDANQSGAVNSTDVSGVKGRSGQTTSASNYLYDQNCSGGINSTDVSAVKGRSGASVVVPGTY